MPKQALRLIAAERCQGQYGCPNDRYAETGIETVIYRTPDFIAIGPNDRYAETGIETEDTVFVQPFNPGPNDRYAETGIETICKIILTSAWEVRTTVMPKQALRPSKNRSGVAPFVSERPLCRNRH